jgi:Ca-activated chloride channel family protein
MRHSPPDKASIPMRFSLALCCLSLLLAICGAGAASAQTTAPAVIVIDGSGSMWGNLGNERASKFDLARASLRLALAKSAPSVRLGLVAFGHRRRSDCSDVETIAAPALGPAEPILAAVDKLNPKGKGPLALALKEAAKQIEPGAPGSLIVIHDGPDNCQQDPCAAAAEIAKSNPRLAIHVIGLALEKADAQRMACVATATKGKMFDVRDALSLNTSIAEAVRLANLDQGGLASQPDAPNAAPAAQAPAPVGAPGLRLSAALAANGPALTRPVAWRIAKNETPNDTLLQRSAADIAEDLPPGKYIVNASLDTVKAQQLVEVGNEGPTSVRLALNAGTLKLMARATKAGDPIANPVLSISVATDASARRVREPVWIGRNPDAEVVLPAGNYIARVEDGLASREALIAVAPGSLNDAQLVLGAGRLELDAVAQAGGEPLGQVTFVISEDDPEAPGGRREIARSAAPQPSFVLPAGTYYVAAASGAAEARDRIAIGAGGNVKHTVILNVGRAVLAAQLDGTAPSKEEKISFRVLRADDPSHEIARSTSATPDFVLTPGRYRFEAQLAGENVLAAADVDIAAGKEFRITLKLQSAQVTIKPPVAAGASATNVHWEIKDGVGHTVLRSGLGGIKTARLAPGRYLLRSDVGESRLDQAFELKPGEQRTVELAPH